MSDSFSMIAPAQSFEGKVLTSSKWSKKEGRWSEEKLNWGYNTDRD